MASLGDTMMTIKINVIYRHDRRYITITRRAETLAFVQTTVVVVVVAAAAKDSGPEHVRFNVIDAEKCLRKRRKKKTENKKRISNNNITHKRVIRERNKNNKTPIYIIYCYKYEILTRMSR